MNKGMIFNIQKFSIHDGPGIRTTVFLKGCPLKCQWCSNPESQLDHIQILYDYDKCIHCQQCVHVCPHGALTHQNNRILVDAKVSQILSKPLSISSRMKIFMLQLKQQDIFNHKSFRT